MHNWETIQTVESYDVRGIDIFRKDLHISMLGIALGSGSVDIYTVNAEGLAEQTGTLEVSTPLPVSLIKFIKLPTQPHDLYIAAVCKDAQSLRVFHINTKRPVMDIQAHDDEIIGLSVNRTRSLFATVAFDGTVKTWSTCCWQAAETFKVPASRRELDLMFHTSVDFNPNDHAEFVTGATNGVVYLWTATPWVRPGKVRRHRESLKHSYTPVTNVYFIPGPLGYLVTAGEDIRIWDYTTRECIGVFVMPTHSVGHICSSWGSDMNGPLLLLTSTGVDSTFALWHCSGSHHRFTLIPLGVKKEYFGFAKNAAWLGADLVCLAWEQGFALLRHNA